MMLGPDHLRAKSMENIPRIDRKDTAGQRHTRSISMPKNQRPNDMQVPLRTGCEEEAVHCSADSKAVRPSDLAPKHAPENVTSVQEEEEEWIQDEMQESVKEQDKESKSGGWIVIPKECWEDEKDNEAVIKCYRCGSGYPPYRY